LTHQQQAEVQQVQLLCLGPQAQSIVPAMQQLLHPHSSLVPASSPETAAFERLAGHAASQQQPAPLPQQLLLLVPQGYALPCTLLQPQ
jgi:hypothetical protein